MEIINIKLVKNAKIKNRHNNYVFGKQKIMEIYFNDETVRYIDLIAKKDITDVSYLKVQYDESSKITEII